MRGMIVEGCEDNINDDYSSFFYDANKYKRLIVILSHLTMTHDGIWWLMGSQNSDKKIKDNGRHRVENSKNQGTKNW